MQPYDTTGRKLPLPKARYETPEPWKDADQKQLLQFLKTPSGTKFLLTLHDVAAGRALSVAERTPHDYGITAGMSVMLGMIENMWLQFGPFLHFSMGVKGRMATNKFAPESHRRMIQSMKRRDGEIGRKALEDDILGAVELILQFGDIPA